MKHYEVELVNRFEYLTPQEVKDKIMDLDDNEKSQLLYLYHNQPAGVFPDNLLVGLSWFEWMNATDFGGKK